jgi:hypothetical protein
MNVASSASRDNPALMLGVSRPTLNKELQVLAKIGARHGADSQIDLGRFCFGEKDNDEVSPGRDHLRHRRDPIDRFFARTHRTPKRPLQ